MFPIPVLHRRLHPPDRLQAGWILVARRRQDLQMVAEMVEVRREARPLRMVAWALVRKT